MALDPATKDKVLSIWRDELDLTPAQLSGVARNIDRESGWNPTEWGDNRTSRGLYQHHGPRLAALQKFAGENYLDPVEQTRFAIHELKTTEAKALSELKSAKTGSAAEEAFRVYFERPASSGGSQYAAKGGSGGSGGMMLALLGRRGSDLSSLLSETPSSTLPETLAAPAASTAAPSQGVRPEQAAGPQRATSPRISQAPPPRRLNLSGLGKALRPSTGNLGGDYRRALAAILARRSANPFA